MHGCKVSEVSYLTLYGCNSVWHNLVFNGIMYSQQHLWLISSWGMKHVKTGDFWLCIWWPFWAKHFICYRILYTWKWHIYWNWSTQSGVINEILLEILIVLFIFLLPIYTNFFKKQTNKQNTVAKWPLFWHAASHIQSQDKKPKTSETSTCDMVKQLQKNLQI